MSKKEEVFELFSQGKRPGDPELEALELKPETVRKYLLEWRGLQEPEPEPEPELELTPGEPVEVSSLETLQLFEFEDRIYGKHRVHFGGVTAVSKDGDKVITLSPDTLVRPT